MRVVYLRVKIYKYRILERLMKRKLLFTVIAWAASSYSVETFAQEQIVEEIQVISTSRRSEGLSDVNAAVSVIGEEELSLLRLMHYQEALNRVPGVNVNRNNGQESLASIRSPVLTGAGACGAFLMAENGIPLRSNSFCNVNQMFDAHTENAERIEVVRGPSSAFWGSNAMHGMINVILPDPGEAGSLTLEAGPRGTRRVQGRFGTEVEGVSNLFLFNGIEETGYQQDSGVDQQKLSWLYELDFGGAQIDGGFTLINLNQETAGYVTGTDAYMDEERRKTNPNPEAFRDSRNGRFWTSFNWDSRGWDLAFTPYVREVNMTFMQHFLPGDPIEDFYHRSAGFQSGAYRELNNGASVALGIDGESTTGKLLQFQANPTVGSAFLRNTIPQGKHYDFTVDAGMIGGFVSFDQPLAENLTFSFGVRVEKVEYDYDNLMIDGRTDDQGVACGFGGCRYSRPSDRGDNFTNVSPKVALSYQLDDSNRLDLRVQRGFRAPQATELYRLQNAQTVADLRSVELDSFELAYSGGEDVLTYSASVYLMDKDNEIITNSSRENLNGAATRHRGFELALAYDLRDDMTLHVVSNYAKHTYEHSQLSGGIDIKANEVDTAPNLWGNYRLTWQPSPTLRAELEWVNMGEYFTNPENTASYDGHDIVNIRAQYQVSEDWTWTFAVLNVFDEFYAERADWTTFTGDRYFVGQPLRAFASVTWNFR